MNAERLHAIAATLVNDLEATKAVKLIKKFSADLEKLSASPTDAALQKEYSSSLREVYSALESSVANTFSPAWRQALVELDIADLLGDRLRKTLKTIIDGNQNTLAVATAEVKALATRVDEMDTALSELVASFEFLEIDAEELEPGECEVGFLIPRQYVHNDLKELGSEFENLNRILGPFAEIATGTRAVFEVRTISASDFGVFLKLGVETAAAVASALNSLVKIYQQIANFRRLRSEMLTHGMPTKALKGVDDEANVMVGRRVGELVDELMKDFTKCPKNGRQHEVKMDLKLSLTSLANRIDAGFNIEVRAEPPELTAQEGEADEEAKAKAKYFAMIGEAQQSLKFMNETGAPILTLPDVKNILEEDVAEQNGKPEPAAPNRQAKVKAVKKDAEKPVKAPKKKAAPKPAKEVEE